MAAYAFAWMRFPGRDMLFVAVFAMQIVPIQVTMIPLLTLYVSPPFGLPSLAGSNAFGGGFYTIWLSHSIFALPLAIYLLHNFMREIPAELIEAARVDGAGHVKIFTRIMLPLMTPGHRGVRHLPVPLGLERPAGGAGVRWRQPRRLAADGAARRAVRLPRAGLAPALGRRVRLAGRAADRLPAACSATSSAACWPEASRAEPALPERLRVVASRRAAANQLVGPLRSAAQVLADRHGRARRSWCSPRPTRSCRAGSRAT